LDSKFAYLDSTLDATYVPNSQFDFVMTQLLLSSIGYYFESDLNAYVLNCAQESLMPPLYVRLLD